MRFNALLGNLHHASTKLVEGKQKQKSHSIQLRSFLVILMHIIILNKLRFGQIGCSGRSGTC